MKGNLPIRALGVILGLFLCNLTIQAQENKNHPIEISIGITPLAEKNVGPRERLDGGMSKDSYSYFAIDAKIKYKISRLFSINTGLEYSKFKIDLRGAIVDPSKPVFRDSMNLSLLEVPVLLSMNLGKYFYAHAGPNFHFQFQGNDQYVDKQNGIGFYAGIGGNYYITSNFGLFVEPFAKANSIILFTDSNYPDRITVLGIKTGLKWRF